MWLKLLFFVSIVAAQYEPLISSTWSMWSPWSFCSNNVMIRVRACSTVRGFKCVGHNKEFQSCSSPPKRNNLDYEDPEANDREMAMRQLYQDYEPETPDEAKYAPTRGNRNFHLIVPTVAPTTQPPSPPTETDSNTHHFSVIDRAGAAGVGVMSEEEEYDETLRMSVPTDPSQSQPTTFEFEKYPKSTERPVTTTEEPTTTESTTTTTTITEATTTTVFEEIEEYTTPEPLPQTVTPVAPRIVEHEVMVGPEDVGFRGKYTLEEPMTEASPPGTMVMEATTTETELLPTPSSFPVEVEPEEERIADGSTHSVGSYSIGREPMWEEEPEPLIESQEPSTQQPPRNIPTFSISPSTRKLGEVRRAPTDTSTHIEMPMSMLPFLPTEEPEQPPLQSQSPKIALVTSQQNMQKFPKMMNEQRAPPRPVSRTVPSPSEYMEQTTRKPKMVTVEITNKTLKKKRRNRRLKKLNRLGKIRTVAVLPTEYTIPAATQPMDMPNFEVQEHFDKDKES
ncbi:unnamed protein product [Caenorhabditis sp. 36 PRJEB53466]|nr:unnamed protein product [Caenorhabditis sp. 36 PRJEB53466]